MIRYAMVVAASAMLLPVVGNAAPSYSGLKAQGYKTSKLTRRGFSKGWIVSKGSNRYFCKFRRTRTAWKYDLQIAQGTPRRELVGSCSKIR